MGRCTTSTSSTGRPGCWASKKEGRMSRPMSRILFPRLLPWAVIIHLDPPLLTGLTRPTHTAQEVEQPQPFTWLSVCRHTSGAPFGLAPGGVYLAARITAGAGALLTHPFTLTCQCISSSTAGRRFPFCGTIPAGRPGLPLATTVLCGVRTFLDEATYTLPRSYARRDYPADSFARS